MLARIVVVAIIFSLTTACAAQQTAFLSNPPGAEVTIDGQLIGTTPCQYDYKLGRGGEHEVAMAKTGFEPIKMVIKADEVDKDARKRWVAAGVVWSPLWLGTLFTKKLKDSYEFTLRKTAPSITARAELPVASVQPPL